MLKIIYSCQEIKTRLPGDVYIDGQHLRTEDVTEIVKHQLALGSRRAGHHILSREEIHDNGEAKRQGLGMLLSQAHIDTENKVVEWSPTTREGIK